MKCFSFTFLLFTLSLSYGLKSKLFEKKYIKADSLDSADKEVLHGSSAMMDKITCSSLCLKKSDDCFAFYIDKNQQCMWIKEPNNLNEVCCNCKYETTPYIWTSKNPKPACKLSQG